MYFQYGIFNKSIKELLILILFVHIHKCYVLCNVLLLLEKTYLFIIIFIYYFPL